VRLSGQDVAVGTGRAAVSDGPRAGAVGTPSTQSTDARGTTLIDVGLSDLTAAPRQFAVVARREGRPSLVVAWGQDFGDGTVMRLQVPGTRIRQIFEHSSPEAALRTLRLLHLGTLTLVWTAPTTEGI
jgi:hypothetical protein